MAWMDVWASAASVANDGTAECLGDAGGEYQPGNFTGNGQNSC